MRPRTATPRTPGTSSCRISPWVEGGDDISFGFGLFDPHRRLELPVIGVARLGHDALPRRAVPTLVRLRHRIGEPHVERIHAPVPHVDLPGPGSARPRLPRPPQLPLPPPPPTH